MSESSTVMIPFHVSALTNGARMRPQAIDQVGCLRPEVLGCESGSVRWLRRPEGWVRRGPRISVAKSSHPTANCSTAWGNSVLTNYPLLGGQQSEPTATRRRRRRALPRQRRPDGAHSPSERPVLPLRQASLCAGTSPVEQRPDPEGRHRARDPARRWRRSARGAARASSAGAPRSCWARLPRHLLSPLSHAYAYASQGFRKNHAATG